MSENKSKAKGNLNKLLDPHVEYVTRNFFAGLASFWFGFASSHFLQKPLRQRLPYSTKLSLGASTVIGSTAAYFIVKGRIDNPAENSEK